MTKRANPSEFWCEETGISCLPEDIQTDRTTCTQQRAACYKNGHTLWSIAVRMSTLIRPSTTVTVSTSEVTWRDDDVSRCADDWRVRTRSEMSSTSPVLLTTGSRSTVSCWRPSKLTVVASVLNTPTHKKSSCRWQTARCLCHKSS